jgi:hypothetical protein
MSLKQALRSELRAWKRWERAKLRVGKSPSVEWLTFTKASNRRRDTQERYAIEGKKGWM